ncbi:MAG: argininosuccinate lyase [Deltaproteobacteria bacterium]|nr:argininosuccinate lyase [Deltaproteobacteria bacterium]
MAKLWEKSQGKRADLQAAVNRYIVNDLAADNILLPFDVEASIAHAQMLSEVGLLDTESAQKIITQLRRIPELHAQGKFVIRQENEDVHTEIENFLVQELGDIGKRVHAGRSRNDQVLVAMRLYVRHELQQTKKLLLATADAALQFASQFEFVPMPGFSHMQHAMPSSVGQWAGAVVESLLDDCRVLDSAIALINQNPLGSAAGFGTALPIQRERTTELLRFDRVQVNSLYCQNSRGKFDAFTIAAMLQVMLTLGKFANDLVVFTSKEFSFFKIHPELTTGSSIMPQKRNLDIMEVLRANVSMVQALQLQAQSAGMNLISGYNKDLQNGKEAVMKTFSITQESLRISALVLQNLEPDEQGLARAFEDKEIFATDFVNELVLKGAAFRDAYKQVGSNLGALSKVDPVQNIKSKTHLGATGNLALDGYRKSINELNATMK